MYKGYKRRNAELDILIESPPEYLAKSQTKLANESFSGVEDANSLEEIHSYIFHQYALLDRVIRARKTHHSHFYAQSMDYGHEKYLNSLITQKLTAQRALERVTQRLAEVLYRNRKWFSWARECQSEEDKQRENEQKKLKREAALFRRQAKELEIRMRELRAKEDAKGKKNILSVSIRKAWPADWMSLTMGTTTLSKTSSRTNVAPISSLSSIFCGSSLSTTWMPPKQAT